MLLELCPSILLMIRWILYDQGLLRYDFLGHGRRLSRDRRRLPRNHFLHLGNASLRYSSCPLGTHLLKLSLHQVL